MGGASKKLFKEEAKGGFWICDRVDPLLQNKKKTFVTISLRLGHFCPISTALQSLHFTKSPKHGELQVNFLNFLSSLEKNENTHLV